MRWAIRTLIIGEHPVDQREVWELREELTFYKNAYERVFNVVYEADGDTIKVQEIRNALSGR
jgi:hypothetical protein